MFLLVDGSHMLHRILRANPGQEGLGGKFGGVAGFLRSLRYTLKNVTVSRCFVVWDGGLSARRRSLLPEYKLRGEKPEDLSYRDIFLFTRGYIDLLLPLLRVTPVLIDGMEGDDVIWEVRSVAFELGHTPCVIVSEDKDFYQMVCPHTSLYRPIRREYVTEESLGKTSQYLLFHKAICGDRSDHIPGVPGVGKVTAESLLQETFFPTLDSLKEVSEASENKRARKVADNMDIVERNLMLVRLGLEEFSSAQLDRLNSLVENQPNGDFDQALSKFLDFGFDELAHNFYEWSVPFQRIGGTHA